MEKINRIFSKILSTIIKSYQYLISPLLGNRCRFYPSCSTYAIEAIELHGIVYGIYLSVRRLLRCHPCHQGGLDLVPEKTRNASQHE